MLQILGAGSEREGARRGEGGVDGLGDRRSSVGIGLRGGREPDGKEHARRCGMRKLDGVHLTPCKPSEADRTARDAICMLTLKCPFATDILP